MKFLNKIDGADKVNVSDNNNKFSSENVEDALEELFDKDFVNIVRNNDSGEGVLPIIPLDADTLGGRPPSYYLGGEFGGGLTEDEIKLIKVNSAINADTVNNKMVETNVPVGAKFTDTVYTHPANHPASMITGLPTSLPADGGNAATVGGFTVGVNVPSNAKFTDTNTTYTGGTNVTISGTTINATDSKRDDSTSEFRLEVRTSDPTSPAIGRMWYRSDL